MILQIPIGGVDGLIDSAQIGMAIRRPGGAIGLRRGWRRSQREQSRRNTGGHHRMKNIPHNPVSMLRERRIGVKRWQIRF